MWLYDHNKLNSSPSLCDTDAHNKRGKKNTQKKPQDSAHVEVYRLVNEFWPVLHRRWKHIAVHIAVCYAFSELLIITLLLVLHVLLDFLKFFLLFYRSKSLNLQIQAFWNECFFSVIIKSSFKYVFLLYRLFSSKEKEIKHINFSAWKL